MGKKRYAFAGASGRGFGMFMQPFARQYAEQCELVGLYDSNPGRARLMGEALGIPVYEDFDRMLREGRPDVVVVTTVDRYHSDYILASLRAGIDVITEKPMTIDAPRCREILETERDTGRHVTVTFNYRFAPFASKIKELVMSGALGDVLSVHFEWLLDRDMDVQAHGTSYFRRWNSRMEQSGGLLVHKSTHHFDLINWWIGQAPQKVSAFGKLNLYGKPGREAYAGGLLGGHCHDCAVAEQCPYRRQTTPEMQRIFLDNMGYDGYSPDRCIYADEIDIYDTMAVAVQYDRGAMLSYSLNATCPYEGWRVAINGSRARLEAYLPETGPDADRQADIIRIFTVPGAVEEIAVPRQTEGHGGGDERLQRMLVLEDQPDPLGLCAGSRDGANSILVGAAANVSIREGRMVDIVELLGDAALLGRA